MTELDLGGEAGGTSSNTPSYDGLRDATTLHSLDEVVLVDSANLAQKEQHLGLGVVLVAKEVVQEAAARVAIATDGNALVDTIRVSANDVVQLVGHAARLGNVGHGARSVEPRHHDVVKHASSVAKTEAARLDASNSGRADHAHTPLLCHLDELLGLLLWDALGDQCHSFEVLVGHGFHGSLVHGPERGEVDEDADVGVLRHCFLGGGIDWHQDLLSAPIELHIVVA
mmetsp:Transcript_70290/g.147152  ORF Transcript_70290/g.147152 Transcript_70290/m.147152 type:complete len:227 (+) Transcript_70290:1116-1796(+)